MDSNFSFIAEIQSAIANGSTERRAQILNRVTDLFVLGAARFTEEDIAIFDDVIGRLATKIEQAAQVLLSTRLAPIPNAPPNTVRSLAFNDAVEVAAPVLSQSPRLDDATLVEVATRKGQGHMLAMTRRPSLSEAVTTVLVERGDRDVLLGAVGNSGARFSNSGFAMLVQRSEEDDAIAAGVGARADVPAHLLHILVTRASETARARLEAANPRAKEAVRQAVSEATDQIRAEALGRTEGYAESIAEVESLQHAGRLDEGALGGFAKRGGFVEASAALAVMCDLPLSFVEQAMASERSENVLLLARAVGLSWPTVREILELRAQKAIMAQRDIARCLASYERLRAQTAQEIVRFYRARLRTQPARPA